MPEGLVRQPILADLMEELQLLSSPRQGLRMGQQALPEPPAPDIGAALLEAGRMLFGPQFLSNSAEVPRTMQEQLGFLAPHGGLVGLGKTGIADTLRALLRNTRGEAVPLPVARLDASLAETIQRLMKERPTGVMMPKDTSLQHAMNAATRQGEVRPWTQGPGFQEALKAGRPVVGLAPEELEGALTFIARLPQQQQRLLANNPEVLADILGRAAVTGQIQSWAPRLEDQPGLHRGLLDLWVYIQRRLGE